METRQISMFTTRKKIPHNMPLMLTYGLGEDTHGNNPMSLGDVSVNSDIDIEVQTALEAEAIEIQTDIDSTPLTTDIEPNNTIDV